MGSRRVIGGALFAAVAILAGCNRDSSVASTFSPATARSLDVQDLVTSAALAGTEGVRRDASPPSPNGGPTVTASGNQVVVNGGTLSVTLQAASPFSAVYLFVGGKTLGVAGEGPGGIGGFYELHPAAAETSDTVLLTFPQSIPLSEFNLQFAVASPSGAVGPYAGLAATAIVVGTGDVQVTLSWDGDSDVDLHVVDPAGEEIFYAHPQSASGGVLDLDSNAGCALDHKRNENITWPVGRAPRGRYTVRVDYWDACGVGQTNYTVRINNGGAGQIFSGSFTGPGDQGASGSGRTITTFERQTGPTASTTAAAASIAAAPVAAKRGSGTSPVKR